MNRKFLGKNTKKRPIRGHYPKVSKQKGSNGHRSTSVTAQPTQIRKTMAGAQAYVQWKWTLDSHGLLHGRHHFGEKLLRSTLGRFTKVTASTKTDVVSDGGSTTKVCGYTVFFEDKKTNVLVAEHADAADESEVVVDPRFKTACEAKSSDRHAALSG